MSAKVTIIAKIYYVNQIETIGERGFQKRTVLLDDSRTKDGNTYPNIIPVEFTGDRMAMLDSFSPGQLVQVEAFVEGREHTGRYFVNIKGWTIAPYQSQQSYQQSYQQSPQQSQYGAQSPFQQAPQQPQQGQYQVYQGQPAQRGYQQQRPQFAPASQFPPNSNGFNNDPF